VSKCQFGKEPPFTKRWQSYLTLLKNTNMHELSDMFDLMKQKKTFQVKNLFEIFSERNMTKELALAMIKYRKDYQ